MDLAQTHDRPEKRARSSLSSSALVVGAELPQEGSTVPLDRSFVVISGETEIKVARSVNTRESSGARRKSMDQPWKFAQLPGVKNVESGLPAGRI